MKSKKISLLILIIVGLGILQFFDPLPLSRNENIKSSENETKSAKYLKLASDSIHVIDFPLLAKARPKDLIDMSLSFPEDLQKLDGQKVSLIGFMAPFDSLEDMSRCMIVPSYVGCTFCTPPNLRQVVFVTQGDNDPETTYSFIEEPSHITGIFRISAPDSKHEGKTQGFVYSIENAEIVPYTGDAPERAAGHATTNGHNKGQSNKPLPPVTPSDLLSEVASMMNQEPLQTIKFEKVSTEVFSQNITEKLKLTYPRSERTARTQAFSLLGFTPVNIDWLEALAGFELGQHIAKPDSTGRHILILKSVPFNHPFVRLDVVGAIAEAIILQHRSKDSQEGKTESPKNEDKRRAEESLISGIQKTIIQRYANAKSISPKILPPVEFKPSGKYFSNTAFLDQWYTLPNFVGPFFVDFLLSPTDPLSDLKSILQRPPSTMIEFLRPLWYENASLWKPNPVPADFANKFMEKPPSLTDVLGIGGLIPWLAQPNSSYVARSIAGQWAGDRWALWNFPDGSAAILLETRWQDEKSALEFSQSIPEHLFQWLFPHKEGSSTVRILRGSTLAALNRVDPFPK